MIQHFEDQVREKLREVMRAQLDNADQREAQARGEHDALSRIAGDLENAWAVWKGGYDNHFRNTCLANHSSVGGIF